MSANVTANVAASGTDGESGMQFVERVLQQVAKGHDGGARLEARVQRAATQLAQGLREGRCPVECVMAGASGSLSHRLCAG